MLLAEQLQGLDAGGPQFIGYDCHGYPARRRFFIDLRQHQRFRHRLGEPVSGAVRMPLPRRNLKTVLVLTFFVSYWDKLSTLLFRACFFVLDDLKSFRSSIRLRSLLDTSRLSKLLFRLLLVEIRILSRQRSLNFFRNLVVLTHF